MRKVVKGGGLKANTLKSMINPPMTEVKWKGGTR